jgi:hypothetical protein
MEGLHDNVSHDLRIARETLGHPVALGDSSQVAWTSMFEKYLPKRYCTATATIVDANGRFSEQIDVVIYDRQYSPLIFEHQDQLVIPAEAIYAVFEAKQEINKQHIQYAQKKVGSVRKLQRTSVQIETIDGPNTKVPQPIIGGFLAFKTRWKKPIEKTLARSLSLDQGNGRLDLGCIASYGVFGCGGFDCRHSVPHARAVTYFLLELITRLQSIGTVPAIDTRAYAKWLI